MPKKPDYDTTPHCRSCDKPDRERAIQLARATIEEELHLYQTTRMEAIIADVMLDFAIEEVQRVPMACYVLERVEELRRQKG